MQSAFIEKAFELVPRNRPYYKPGIRVVDSLESIGPDVKMKQAEVSGRFETPDQLALAIRSRLDDALLLETFSIGLPSPRTWRERIERVSLHSTVFGFHHLAKTEYGTGEEMMENARRYPDRFLDAATRVSRFFLERSTVDLDRPLYSISRHDPEWGKERLKHGNLTEDEMKQIKNGIDAGKKTSPNILKGRYAQIGLFAHWLPYSLWIHENNQDLCSFLRSRKFMEEPLMDRIIDYGLKGKSMSAVTGEIHKAVHEGGFNDYRKN